MIANPNSRSLKIAKGVAYAASNKGTIEDFFLRGAAFGVQTKQRPLKGNGNPDDLWDDCAFFLFDKVLPANDHSSSPAKPSNLTLKK